MGKLYVTGSVYAVVALERFLAVEAGAGDCSRRVVHGDVERCFFGAEPFRKATRPSAPIRRNKRVWGV